MHYAKFHYAIHYLSESSNALVTPNGTAATWSIASRVQAQYNLTLLSHCTMQVLACRHGS